MADDHIALVAPLGVTTFFPAPVFWAREGVL